MAQNIFPPGPLPWNPKQENSKIEILRCQDFRPAEFASTDSKGGVRGGKRFFLFSEFWVEFVKNKYQNLMVIQFGTAQGQSHFFRRFIVFWHGWRGKVSIDFWHAEGVPKIDRNRAYAHGGVASTNDISNNFKKLAPKAPLKIF